jgi:hypothetical protein
VRVVFVRSREAKERLKATPAPQNVEKTMAAPVTAIVANDLEYLYAELRPGVRLAVPDRPIG